MNIHSLVFDIESLTSGYREKNILPSDVVSEVYRRIETQGEKYLWECLVPRADAMDCAKKLEGLTAKDLPLYGIPFSVKDNIHVKGLYTTASCKAFSHFPKETAHVVEKLLAAGAILIGKNTMDQFATGLVGIRRAEHPVNPFNKEYIPGGSSSGSAVAVATGLVSFSLGSDTGGSGRVPAALNNIVGLKPTPGLLSTHGMVYANRSFDCVPIFALNCSDAETVFEQLQDFDEKDPFAITNPTLEKKSIIQQGKWRVAIPNKTYLTFFGDTLAENEFNKALEKIQSLGGEIIEIDFSLFLEAGEMIFNGPFLAERFASLETFFATNRDDVDPVVGGIVEKAQAFSAVDLINEYYRLKEIQREVSRLYRGFDFLMVPTAGRIYKIQEVKADPVNLNANMGYYTYYANILKLSALAIPAAIRSDGLPFGVCFLAEAQKDKGLIELGKEWENFIGLSVAAENFL